MLVIFYLNCEHVLFVYILKQRRTFFCGFKKNSRIFKKLNFFTNVMSHKKFGPDRFSRFDVYWIQTNRQTDRQAKLIYRYARHFSHDHRNVLENL